MVVLGNSGDFYLRKEVAEFNANAGDDVSGGAITFVDGVLYTNPTNGPLTVPADTSIASMTAAGFALFSGGAGVVTPPPLPSNAVAMPYADVKNLVDTATLVPGLWYKITDYQAHNLTHFGLINHGAVEPIYVQAVDVDKIDSLNVLSAVWPNDVMIYDINTSALTEHSNSEWEDEDSIGAVNVSNRTASTVDIDVHFEIDGDFYMEVEDSTNSVSWDASDEGVAFSVSYPSPGVTRITDLLGAVQFNDPIHNYGAIDFNVALSVCQGRVLYRTDVVARIEAVYDFRGYRFARKKMDVSGVPNYTFGTTYAEGSKVMYGGYMYLALRETQALTNDETWFKMPAIGDYLHASTSLGYITIALDDTPQLIPTFAVNGNTDYSRVSDVKLLSEDCVFDRTSSYVEVARISVGPFCSKFTFRSTVSDVNFPRSSYNVIGPGSGSITNVTFRSYVNNVVITRMQESTSGYLSRVFINYVRGCDLNRLQLSSVRQAVDSTIGSTYKVHFGSIYTCKLGNGGSFSFFKRMAYCEIGSSYDHIATLTTSFYYNKIGDRWKSMTIEGRFGYVNLGHVVGPNVGVLTLTQDWYYVDVGSVCFYNTTVLGRVNNSRFGNGVDAMDVPGDIEGTIVEHNARHIEASNIYDSVFGPGCEYIRCKGSIKDSHFAPGCYKITLPRGDVYQNNYVAVSATDIDGSPELFDNKVHCEVVQAKGGPITKFEDLDFRTIMKHAATGDLIRVGVSNDANSDAYLEGTLTHAEHPGAPADPAEGESVTWLNGTGRLKIKINVGGTVHIRTIAAF